MGKGMKAGKKPKVGQAQQMQQIQAMQARLQAAQAEIEAMETEAGAGGGAVTVKVNGKHEMVSININPDVLDDAEMLQDLIVAATNEAMRQMEELSQAKMSTVTGGFGF
ncbi:MAG: YbaB/EbfC family nucleoid-associated protein [Clostridia bacterium]|nr:YbaB/EbfC family nucleoid-associated protein [Clostridia bacterium]